jgi:trehalose 6-phosphate phosphatase
MIARPLHPLSRHPVLARAARSGWLLAFDFDGTLAPLVADPDAAAIPPPVHDDLATLATLRPVAVITGRSRENILPRLPGSIAHVIGNHGCEWPDSDPARLAAALEVAAYWHARLADGIQGTGLRLESKGPSLALHWRGCADPRTMADIASSLAIHLHPRPHLIAGDQVLNLLPPGLPDKGTALLRLLDLTGSTGALFVGDDITDAAVFRLRDPGIVGIEVGHKGLGADWRVEDTEAVAALVRELVMLTATDQAGRDGGTGDRDEGAEGRRD